MNDVLEAGSVVVVVYGRCIVSASNHDGASNTVIVPGTAALPDNPGGTGGATPAVDSGLDVSVSVIQVVAFGSESPFAGHDNYPDDCCFNARFLDSVGTPIVLSSSYPAVRLCDVIPAPCSAFYPITPVGGLRYSLFWHNGNPQEAKVTAKT